MFGQRVHIHTSGGGDSGVFGYIVLGLLVLGIIAFVIVVAVKVSKMRREEAARLHAGLPPNPDFPMTQQQVQNYAPPQPQQWAPQQPQGYPQQPMPPQGYPQGRGLSAAAAVHPAVSAAPARTGRGAAKLVNR